MEGDYISIIDYKKDRKIKIERDKKLKNREERNAAKKEKSNEEKGKKIIGEEIEIKKRGEFIGKGAFGEVYMIRDKDKTKVLKRIIDSEEDEADFEHCMQVTKIRKTMFTREKKFVLKAYKHSEGELLMKKYETDLKKYIESGNEIDDMFILRSFLALELFRKSVCDPRNSIRVAGDIKPENIFLYHYNEQLIPVIGDFDGRSLRKSGFDVNGTIKEDEGISRTSIYVFEDKNKIEYVNDIFALSFSMIKSMVDSECGNFEITARNQGKGTYEGFRQEYIKKFEEEVPIKDIQLKRDLIYLSTSENYKKEDSKIMDTYNRVVEKARTTPNVLPDLSTKHSMEHY